MPVQKAMQVTAQQPLLPATEQNHLQQMYFQFFKTHAPLVDAMLQEVKMVPRADKLYTDLQQALPFVRQWPVEQCRGVGACRLLKRIRFYAGLIAAVQIIN
jgi:hypothetical protein